MSVDAGNSRNLPNISRAPTQAPVSRIFDTLLVPTGTGTFQEHQAHPSVGDPHFDLGRGLSIVIPPYDLVELVMNACSQRGHYFIPTRQFGCRFSFELEHPLEPEPCLRWDPDGIISQTVALSRLVRDNAYSTEYAARVVEHADGERQVIPHGAKESSHAYRLGTGRDWLDSEDAEQLRALLQAWTELRETWPQRLRLALWTCEHVAWEYYTDISLPALVAALEGLISTDHRQVARQFCTRVPLLADQLNVPDVSRSFCTAMYKARSQGFHGSDIGLLRATPHEDAAAKVAKLQAVLRAAIRRAIEDPDFRAVFGSDDTIRTRWPVLYNGEPL